MSDDFDWLERQFERAGDIEMTPCECVSDFDPRYRWFWLRTLPVIIGFGVLGMLIAHGLIDLLAITFGGY